MCCIRLSLLSCNVFSLNEQGSRYHFDIIIFFCSPFAGGVKFQMEGTEEYTKGVPDAFISTFDEVRSNI